jgi:hypothetical protein
MFYLHQWKQLNSSLISNICNNKPKFKPSRFVVQPVNILTDRILADKYLIRTNLIKYYRLYYFLVKILSAKLLYLNKST